MGHTLINTLTHLVCALQRTSTHPQLSEPSPKQMPPSNYGSLRVAAPFLPFTKIYEICFTTNCRGSLSETARSLGSHAVRQIVCVCVPGVCACVARSQVGGGEHGPQEPVIGSSRTRMSSELKLRVQTSFSYYVRYKGKRQRQNQQFPGLGQVNRPLNFPQKHAQNDRSLPPHAAVRRRRRFTSFSVRAPPLPSPFTSRHSEIRAPARSCSHELWDILHNLFDLDPHRASACTVLP
jgi:hypothetical protein